MKGTHKGSVMGVGVAKGYTLRGSRGGFLRSPISAPPDNTETNNSNLELNKSPAGLVSNKGRCPGGQGSSDSLAVLAGLAALPQVRPPWFCLGKVARRIYT